MRKPLTELFAPRASFQLSLILIHLSSAAAPIFPPPPQAAPTPVQFITEQLCMPYASQRLQGVAVNIASAVVAGLGSRALLMGGSPVPTTYGSTS